MSFFLFDTIVHVRYVTSSEADDGQQEMAQLMTAKNKRRPQPPPTQKLSVVYAKALSPYRIPQNIAMFCYPEKPTNTPLICPQPFAILIPFSLYAHLYLVNFLHSVSQLPLMNASMGFVCDFQKTISVHLNVFVLLRLITGFSPCKNS